jgi:hypothetical protein
MTAHGDDGCPPARALAVRYGLPGLPVLSVPAAAVAVCWRWQAPSYLRSLANSLGHTLV